ncbi:MAG: hypothetical protein PSX36_01345 [bacterium]|nr:hypothetical protein [bacterium]
MKKLILMAAFTGLLVSSVAAGTYGDDKGKKSKKECCAAKSEKACAGEKKEACAKGEKSCCKSKTASTTPAGSTETPAEKK